MLITTAVRKLFSDARTRGKHALPATSARPHGTAWETQAESGGPAGAALRAGVNAALARPDGGLSAILTRCLEVMVTHLDAAFAGVWVLQASENVLELQASAGLYTPREGPHSRVPMGAGEIGRVAQEKRPYVADALRSAGHFGTDSWTRGPGTLALMGFPLLVEEQVVGVLAVFARGPLLPGTIEACAAVGDILAQTIDRKRLEQALVESEERQRLLMRQVLSSATEHTLRLCDTPADLPPRLGACGDSITLSVQTLPDLRGRALEAARAAGLDEGRAQDLVTAAGETSLNAVVHAGGGRGYVGMDAASGRIQVWIEDQGDGMVLELIPRMTLERGYSGGTSPGIGHGFCLILGTIDRCFLLTGPSGTTVVLEQDRVCPEPDWMDGLS